MHLNLLATTAHGTEPSLCIRWSQHRDLPFSFFPEAAAALAAAPPLLFAVFRDCFVDEDDGTALAEAPSFSARSLSLLSPKAAAAYVARMPSALAEAWAMALHSPLTRMLEAKTERRWQKSRYTWLLGDGPESALLVAEKAFQGKGHQDAR